MKRFFVLTLTALFAITCLFSMNLSAHHTDHDNIYVNDIAAQTSLGISYSEPFVNYGAYANILNLSDIAVRYYFSASAYVWRGDVGVGNPSKQRSDGEKGLLPAGGWISFFPDLAIDMSGALKGEYTATGDVGLTLKFDFNNDGVFDDEASVGSSAELEFEVE